MRVAYHALFLQDILPSDINVVFWSLGVEAKYYALVPFLLLPMLGVKSWRMLLILGLTAALMGPVLRWLIFVNSDVSDYETFWPVLRSPFYACLEPFALGFVVACLERRGALAISAKAGLALLPLAFACLLFVLGSQDLMKEIRIWDVTGQPFLLAVTFAVMIVAAINMTAIQTPFEPLFRAGARISYSLYLVHLPLIPISLISANKLDLGVFGFWLIYVGTSLAHAVIILAYIETPFLKSRWFPFFFTHRHAITNMIW